MGIPFIVVALMALIPLFMVISVIFSGFAGWLFALIFPESFSGLIGWLGVDWTGFEAGAILGFIGSFFKSYYTAKDK